MKKVVVFLILIVSLFVLEGSFLKKQKSTDSNNLGIVDKETVTKLISRFNKEILDNSGLDEAKIDSMTTQDGMYFFNITEGIYLVVLPLDKQKSIEEDVVNSMRLYVASDYRDDPQVLAYAKMLIIANNDNITSAEAQNLISEAIYLTNKRITSNNGKGICVGYIKADNHDEYQVIRNYTN